MIDELGAKGPRVPGGVRVVAEAIEIDVLIRIEHDVNVVRLERPRSRLASAAHFALRGMRVCTHQAEDGEAGEEEEGNLLNRRHLVVVVLPSCNTFYTVTRRKLLLYCCH